MDPKEFLHAVFIEQLPLVLGGGIGSLVWILWSLVQKKRPDDTVLWPTVIAVFFACALAWNVEHEARVKAEGQAKTNAIVFLATIDNVLMSAAPGAEAPTADAFVQLSIVNRGAPTLLAGYTLRIRRDGQPERAIPARNIPKEMEPPDDPRFKQILDQLQISPATALDVKTTQKIPRGDLVRGWLRFPISLADLALFDEPGTDIAVTFVDYLGTVHESKTSTSETRTKIDNANLPPGMVHQFYCPGLAE